MGRYWIQIIALFWLVAPAAFADHLMSETYRDLLVIRDPKINETVSKLVHETFADIEKETGRRPAELEVRVIDLETFNARIFRRGEKVFVEVFRGCLEGVSNLDQLRAIIEHEAAHWKNGDLNKKEFADHTSQINERRADQDGLIRMIRRGENPWEIAKFWEGMAAQEGRNEYTRLIKLGGSHPDPGQRAVDIRDMLKHILREGLAEVPSENQKPIPLPYIKEGLKDLSAVSEFYEQTVRERGDSPKTRIDVAREIFDRNAEMAKDSWKEPPRLDQGRQRFLIDEVAKNLPEVREDIFHPVVSCVE